MKNNNELIVVDKEMLAARDTIRKAITKKHEKVSKIKTPKPFIKKKNGMDYVEIGYMRKIADDHFPGWSWTIQKTEVLGSEAYVVHGRLKWYDEGIWREGDMVAAHRIQKLRGTNDFVDIGNDIKASNTDCMKKALQMFMNIADDVYRNQVEDLTLTDEQKNDILVVASELGEEKMNLIHTLIKDQAINNANYGSSKIKLEKELERKNEKSK